MELYIDLGTGLVVSGRVSELLLTCTHLPYFKPALQQARLAVQGTGALDRLYAKLQKLGL